jgi:hypothetical protein
MRKFTAHKALAVAGAMLAAVVSAGPATAATPVVVGGKLTGATGVDVGGTLYDVAFVDGSCTSLFTGCDAASDFAFQTLAGAQAARNALLTQVLIGTYDSDPGLTAGCSLGSTTCIVYVPYGVSGANVLFASLTNGSASNSSGDGLQTASLDLGQFTGQTYARFLLAATSVPEPASWAMMLLGFAGIGLALRRRGLAWSAAA